MADCTFMLTQILFICYFLMVNCTQPHCSSVKDFDDCLGNTTDFCPRDVACACKDGKPFCKCPNYRGQWGDYWYMGDKCKQLWTTVDLILVATLPGIALAVIVGVAIQIIHYCKRESKKNERHHREERSMPELQPYHNSAYGLDTDRNFPQLNQSKVNTEIRLSNKLIMWRSWRFNYFRICSELENKIKGTLLSHETAINFLHYKLFCEKLKSSRSLLYF
ncbi:RGD1561958 [Phodopus roborovskii]|uniref:RGD1561958 protein n=1 Tax=Phodopus roborovskii TaxID=109678 RepID=A0AAU9Z0M8_PHORO|nr:RGD1561958 [Phodopus roborovskii]